jgi:HK97 family phage major capsid protein
MGGELDFQAMEGPGTVFTGVQSAVSVGDCARTNGTNGVVLSYSSSTSTIASLTQIFTKAGEGITRGDGIFVCGPGVFQKIIGLVDTNGQPIVKLGTVENQPNNTILGRPIVVTNRLPAYTVGAGTVSVGSLYYGSPSGLIFGNRRAMTFEVTNAVHWGTYQGDCRLIGRFGYVVGVPAAWAMQKGIVI